MRRGPADSSRGAVPRIPSKVGGGGVGATAHEINGIYACIFKSLAASTTPRYSWLIMPQVAPEP